MNAPPNGWPIEVTTFLSGKNATICWACLVFAVAGPSLIDARSLYPTT
jgi:hypothetical protein